MKHFVWLLFSLSILASVLILVWLLLLHILILAGLTVGFGCALVARAIMEESGWWDRL